MAANHRKSSCPPDSLELLSERMKSLSDRISLTTWAILIITTIFGLIANLLLNRIAGVETRLDNRIAGVETRLDNRIAGVETALGNRMDRLENKFDAMAETLKQIQIDNAKWQASLDMLLKNPAPYREVPRSPEATADTGGSPGQNPQPESGQAEPALK
jgi:sensor domain CHASE-containing protein